MPPSRAADARLRAIIRAERRRLARGERPLYHVTWIETAFGPVDVTVREFPLIHLFVPDPGSAVLGGRILIASALVADPDAFDVTFVEAMGSIES